MGIALRNGKYDGRRVNASMKVEEERVAVTSIKYVSRCLEAERSCKQDVFSEGYLSL